ncbi:hypothetical protein I4U23_025121 [Adineta vaga]|nr:hypothetical protein I4U23_025121 [Adineta vaga]
MIIQFSSIKSVPLSDDILIENDSSSNLMKPLCDVIHPINFISLICQQQEQYPLKLTRKLCSNSIHLYKTQQQEQQQKQQPREKRVGWTISV